MPLKSRKTEWMRDERLLVLNLYFKEGTSASRGSLKGMSDLLRSIPIEPELASAASFRSEASVTLKLGNFGHLDPECERTGMSSAGPADRAVWDEYSGRRAEMSRVAEALKRTIREGSLPETALAVDLADGFEAEAIEGRIATVTHRVRERDKKLVERRKRYAFKVDPLLRCEGCGFSFVESYGPRGQDFIECHHTLPISEMLEESLTKIADLAVVCSDCHRMIHRNKPWLTMAEVRELVLQMKGL